MKIKPDNSSIKCLYKIGITGLLNPELNFFNQKRGKPTFQPRVWESLRWGA